MGKFLITMYTFQFISLDIILSDTLLELIFVTNFIMAMIFISWISIFAIRIISTTKLNHVITKTANQTNEDLKESEYLKIKHLILSEKLYKNINFNIQNLSQLSGIPSRKISKLINHFYGNNFNSFINTFRIDEAKILISSENFKNYTMEAIAKESGFNSKSSFNAHFRNKEGMTPTAYRTMYKNSIII